MKQIIVLTLSLILISCTSQATELPTATLAPSTSTPIPTPTLHPEFIELQNLIADSSENLTLLPNGQIEENGVVIPNLQVDQNGEITILVEGESIIVNSADITFENGFQIKGYEFENGEWIETMSKAIQWTTAQLDKYEIDSDILTITEVDGVVTVTLTETGEEIMRGDRFAIGFAADTIAKSSCEPTDFKPSKSGLMLAESVPTFNEYMMELFEELNAKLSNGLNVYSLLLDREKQCWGVVIRDDLLYRDEFGKAKKLPIIHLTSSEIDEFRSNR